VRRAENAGQQCHFRERGSSHPTGNFRSRSVLDSKMHLQRATSGPALLLLHTSASPTRRATKICVDLCVHSLFTREKKKRERENLPLAPRKM